MSRVYQGAAKDWTQDFLGGPTVETDKTVSVGTSQTLIVGNNSDRVSLVIVNLGSGTVFLSMTGTPSATRGIVLSANGGSVTLTLRDDFTLLTREFDAVSDAQGPYSVYVIENQRYYKVPKP